MAEDVVIPQAELPEEVPHVEIAVDVLLAEALMKARLTELIVLAFFIGIGKDRVGFGDFLEFFLGFLISGVLVGVEFESLLAVSLFYRVRRGVLLHAEQSVVILGHRCSPEVGSENALTI
jgi:hypothetical protein